MRSSRSQKSTSGSEGDVAPGEVAGLHQPADHRPVFIALRFLRPDQVGQREQLVTLRHPVPRAWCAVPKGRETDRRPA